MSDQWPDPVYVDGNFDVAEPISLPVFSSPVRSTTEEYIFTQDWMMSRKRFVPTPLNTAHPSYRQIPDYSDFKLVMEGPRQDVGGGMVKWSRTYAKVPASHDEFESYSYAFIGFLGVWTVGNLGTSVQATGRPRQSHIVTARVRHDYFLIGPGGSYASASLIPIIKGQRYFASIAGPTPTLDVEYVWDIGGSLANASVPSRTEYEALIAAETEIVAEDSRLSRWLGNIFLRQVRYVVAK